MGQFEKYWNGDGSVHRRIGRWIAFWMVSISILMIVGAPTEENQ